MAAVSGARWGYRFWLRLLVGSLLAVLALWLLARQIDWRVSLQYVAQAQPGWLALSVAAVFVNNWAKAQRWRALFPPGSAPMLSDALGGLLAGQLLNALLPFRSGDVARAYLLGRRQGAGVVRVAGAIGAEKVIDILVLTALLFSVLPMFVLPGWLRSSLWGAGVAALLAVLVWAGVLLALPAAQHGLAHLPARWPGAERPAQLLRRLLDGFSALRQRQQLPALLGWSLLAWVAAIGSSHLLLRTVNLQGGNLAPALALAILVVVVIQGGLSVPVAPGHMGVFEWLAVLALGVVGVAGDLALAFGLIAHAVVLFFPLCLGGAWLLRQL